MSRVLILGGTQFIGRRLVEHLIENTSHELFLFNRQVTEAGLFPDTQSIKGDRSTNDIQQIANWNWDYVIDTSCYFPQQLEGTLENLKKDLKKYIFISTCSVYVDSPKQMKSEEDEIHSCNADQKVDKEPQSYGRRKAECERILVQSGIEHLILRPALVYGPYDHTDRLYYWIQQVLESEILMLPDGGQRTFSMTYVDDLVKCITTGIAVDGPAGVFNVITEPRSSIKRIVDSISSLMKKETRQLSAKPEFLKSQGISQWLDMPLWIDGDHFTFSNAKLKTQEHMDFAPLDTSLEVTMKYYNDINWPKPQYGMPEHKRLELLKQLQNHH